MLNIFHLHQPCHHHDRDQATTVVAVERRHSHYHHHRYASSSSSDHCWGLQARSILLLSGFSGESWLVSFFHSSSWIPIQYKLIGHSRQNFILSSCHQFLQRFMMIVLLQISVDNTDRQTHSHPYCSQMTSHACKIYYTSLLVSFPFPLNSNKKKLLLVSFSFQC